MKLKMKTLNFVPFKTLPNRCEEASERVIKIRLWSMELFAKILKNQTNDISFRFVPVLEMLCLYLVSQEKFCTFYFSCI